MNKADIFTARLADRSVIPMLTCGHCGSMLSKTRVFVNKTKPGVSGHVLAYCSADDCCAINCCDEALSSLENDVAQQAIAS
ncbi:MAG: hypothetical protein CL583_03995 [Alteromonadaceae bacterium]|nr:hypothetical protein [Alteromonadaceae bacterium]